MGFIEGILVIVSATAIAVWINDNFSVGDYEFDGFAEK